MGNSKLVRSKDNIKNSGEVFTPTHIVDVMLDLIPDHVWNDPEYVFIEPSCGNGQFIERIYRRRVEAGIDPQRAIDTLIGLDISNQNILDSQQRIGDGVDITTLIVVNDSLVILDEYKRGAGILSKYDLARCVVVGNPPYQIFDAGDSSMSKPLYHLFIEAIIDSISPDYFSFVIPSRWMLGGKGLDAHRTRMMNDTHMRKIVHFKNPRIVFPDVGIAGGVNYFLWDKSYSGPCEFVVGNTSTTRYLNSHDIIIQDNNSFGIVDRVLKQSTSMVSSKCTSSNPFGLRGNYSGFVPSGVPCVCQNRTIKYVDPTAYSDRYGFVGKWKVVTGRVTSEGNIKESLAGYIVVLTNMFIIEPGSVCIDSYIVVNSFDTETEAMNFLGYMKTKFFRFMLSLRVSGIDISKDKFAWVPELHDYSHPINDNFIYLLFGVSDIDRNYIDVRIRELKD